MIRRLVLVILAASVLGVLAPSAGRASVLPYHQPGGAVTHNWAIQVQGPTDARNSTGTWPSEVLYWHPNLYRETSTGSWVRVNVNAGYHSAWTGGTYPATTTILWKYNSYGGYWMKVASGPYLWPGRAVGPNGWLVNDVTTANWYLGGALLTTFVRFSFSIPSHGCYAVKEEYRWRDSYGVTASASQWVTFQGGGQVRCW